MTFSFNTSLSGLNANSNALSVIGNNIANANTIGFRSSSITFADIYANAAGARLNGAGNARQIGSGVQVSATYTDFSQGNFNESTSSLHAAIQGDGFFTVQGSDGAFSYTRAGDFTVSSTGFLVSPNGSQVQGFQAVNGVIPQGALLNSLKFPLGETLAPQATSSATFQMNLDSEATIGSEFHATVEVFDSRGNRRTLDLTFTRLADGTFDMTGELDGVRAQASADGGAPSNAPVNFVFDANGGLTSPTSLSIIPDQTQLGGAILPSIEINLRDTTPGGTLGDFSITSYSLPSAVGSTKQNGFPAGELSGAGIDQNGVILGIFSNGKSRIIGQYAIATFNSDEGLQRIGGNMYVETSSSGQATIGAPNTGGRGLIAGGFLEQSNVNITNEFIDLIEAQRGFQANSRVISNLNQTFQELLQII